MRVYEASIKYRVVGSIPAIRTLNTADRVAEYMRDAFDNAPLQESFWIIALNRKNRALARHMVTLGTTTATLADPPTIFRPLFLIGATGFIISHNHPSGVMPHALLYRMRLSRPSEMLQLDAA